MCLFAFFGCLFFVCLFSCACFCEGKQINTTHTNEKKNNTHTKKNSKKNKKTKIDNMGSDNKKKAVIQRATLPNHELSYISGNDNSLSLMVPKTVGKQVVAEQPQNENSLNHVLPKLNYGCYESPNVTQSSFRGSLFIFLFFFVCLFCLLVW